MPKLVRPVAVGSLVLLVIAGCSGEDPAETQKECDAIANDIRKAAELRGISSQGICSSTSPAVQKDFGNACAALKDCNRRLDEAS